LKSFEEFHPITERKYRAGTKHMSKGGTAREGKRSIARRRGKKKGGRFDLII